MGPHAAPRLRIASGAVAILGLSLLASCRTVPAPACGAEGRPAVQDLVYFGTQKPGGWVSEADWTAFLADTVTPRFPDGLTAWPASGQWRSASGELAREPSFVLSLVHPADASHDTAIREIVETYRTRFDQEAVLQVRLPACVALR